MDSYQSFDGSERRPADATSLLNARACRKLSSQSSNSYCQDERLDICATRFLALNLISQEMLNDRSYRTADQIRPFRTFPLPIRYRQIPQVTTNYLKIWRARQDSNLQLQA